MEDTQRLGCRVKLPGMLYPPLIPALSVIIGASVVSSLPRQLEPVEFFEEDIILSDEEMRVILGQEEQVDYYRDIGGGEWPRGVLYYDFAPGEFGPSQTSAVLDAMAEIERYSCVRFQRRTAAEPTYVLLRNTGGQGCASRVGYFPLGKGIDLYLNGANCYSRGTIEHELLHALGFWHEHTRPDRDHYITILWNNVVRGKEYNFKKRGDPGDWTLQLPYDYGSVMHYRPAAFSRDGSSPTLLATDPAAAASMGQRVRASNLDLAKLNRLYRCPYPFYKGEDLVRG